MILEDPVPPATDGTVRAGSVPADAVPTDDVPAGTGAGRGAVKSAGLSRWWSR